MPLNRPISSIMTIGPVVANQFHNFSQVLRLFTEFPVHHLPVVDSKNKLVGILSSNDLSKVFLKLCTKGGKIPMDLDVIDREINISDIMTPNPVTISSGENIGTAAKIFADKRFMCLPVVDSGELIGIITLKDIVTYFANIPVNSSGQ